MAKQTSQYYPVGVRNAGQQFAPADSTALKDVIAAGGNDSIVRSLIVTTTESASNKIAIYLNDGTTDFLLATIALQPGTGSNGSNAAADALAASFFPLANGKRFLPLNAGWKIRAAMASPVGSGSLVHVLAVAEDY